MYPRVSIRTGPWGRTEGSLWDRGLISAPRCRCFLNPCEQQGASSSRWTVVSLPLSEGKWLGAGGEARRGERPQCRAVLGGTEGLQPPGSAQAAGQQAGAAGWHPPAGGLRAGSHPGGCGHTRNLPVPPPGCSFVHGAAPWCHRAWVLQAKKPDSGFCQYNANFFFFFFSC